MSKLDIFKKICDENKDKVMMPKPINYPINYKRGMEWAASHCNSKSAYFAGQIISKTIYVPFIEFMEQLKKICLSFKKHYKKDKNNVYVLILPYTIDKSNFWVSTLCYEWIGDIIDDIHFSIVEVYNIYIYEEKTGQKNVICILCDDCMYTGLQVNTYCSLLSTGIKYKNKPEEPDVHSDEWLTWKKNTMDDIELIENNIDLSKFSINLIIPYIGTTANNAVKTNKFIKLPKDIKMFKSFREEVDVQILGENTISEFERSFQYHSGISAIYFDHKIADSVSTFNKVFLLSPIFNCNVINASVPFIDGCDNSKKIPAGINIYDTYINVEDELQGNVCPPTFYKSIKYTYEGADVDSTKTVEEIFDRLLK
jgi:hypothetical protein